MAPLDKRELVVLLRQEVLRGRMRRGGAVFRETSLCLNYGTHFPTEPCSRCPLLEFVPPECQGRPLPCFDIPLDGSGRASALLGTVSGVELSRHFSPARLRHVFAVFILLIGLVMILRNLSAF